MKVWKIIVLLADLFVFSRLPKVRWPLAMEVTEGSKLGDVTPAGQNI